MQTLVVKGDRTEALVVARHFGILDAQVLEEMGDRKEPHLMHTTLLVNADADTLNTWFMKDIKAQPPYLVGSLLWWREVKD